MSSGSVVLNVAPGLPLLPRAGNSDDHGGKIDAEIRHAFQSASLPRAVNASALTRRKYYEDECVQRRIAEFFGGAIPDRASAVSFAAGTEASSNHRDRRPLEEMQSWMRQGAELNRSLWDRRGLIAHLDIEHVNFDRPASSYLEAERAFHLQEPVVTVVEELLGSFGIPALHVLTGRGHHFVWQIAQGSEPFGRLASLGHLPASLQRLYASEQAPTGERVQPALGAAFAGLGLVMEFIAHRIKEEAAPHCALPVELAAIEVGAGPHGREMIAVDITEYADPLCTRITRAPFSVYLKALQDHFPPDDEAVRRLPSLFIIPIGDLTLDEALAVRRDVHAVKAHAKRTPAAIPDVSEAMGKLIAAYEVSLLAGFHQEYYSEQHDAPAMWPETYDRTPLEALPACVRRMLEQPNDLLLRPACVRRVVRVMLALGWHPRHIAGLIRSKYERDFGWGDQWQGFDPATRADFYARVFSGLFFTGVDDLVDFNCQSARDAHLCLIDDCQRNLQNFRELLLNRRRYERLAHRTVHRMPLAEEHL